MSGRVPRKGGSAGLAREAKPAAREAGAAQFAWKTNRCQPELAFNPVVLPQR
jgi:hypothetical protein